MASTDTGIRFHDGSLLQVEPHRHDNEHNHNQHTHSRSLTPPLVGRRSQPDSDDDEDLHNRPRLPRRSYSKEEWERSLALAEKLQTQEWERRRQEQLEQEQLDVQLARKLMEEEISDSSCDHDSKELQEQLDCELAQQLLEESSRLDLSLIHRMEDESRARRLRAGPIPLENLLEPCQQRAVQYVRQQAEQMHNQALPFLMDRIMHLGFEPEDLQICLQYIRDDAPIIIHLTEVTLTQLTRDTHYRNLFEVHTSGGCKDKSKRATWETTMFGNCYDDHCPPFERPKYGCLNITGDIAGVRSARRYGNCYLTLHEHVRQRATFFDRDSGGFVAQRTLATNEYYAHILNEYNHLDLQAAMNVACNARVGGARSWCSVYKEVQIHGPIQLAYDIQAVSLPGREADATPEFRQSVLEFQTQTNCNVLWQLDLLDPEFVEVVAL
jgi:Protein of unknown function (DUF3626)